MPSSPRRAAAAALAAPLLLLAARATGGEAALRFSGGRVLRTAPVPLEPHTIELWAHPEGSLPPASQPAVLLDWDGRVELLNSLGGLEYLVDLGNGQPARLAVPGLPAGEWHHVAAEFDGSRLLLLVDAKLAG